jgi:hypothetical protein
MPISSLPSRRDLFHQQRVVERLSSLLDLLGALPDRRAPLPADIAGNAHRTLGAAAAIVGTDILPPAGTQHPAAFFVATLRALEALSDCHRSQNRAAHAGVRKIYPRRSLRP